MQQSSSYWSPELKKGNTCSWQAVTTVRQPFSSQFPCWQMVRSMKSASFAVLKIQQAGVFQAPQPLCEEDSLVADAAVFRLPGILSLPGIMLPVPVQSRNEQSIEQLLPCRKNTSTCASSMSCRSCQLMWGSCSNPVHIGHQYWRQGTHAGVRQWPQWDNHSLASFHPRQKVRSMKSFSSAMLKAEKAWAWQTPQTLSWQDSWVADATVLRIPGILSLQSCWLFQFRAGMSNALNNFCRAGRTNTCVSSMSCESCSLANWCGVHAGSQFAFITSTEQRAHTHTQMGSNQNSFSQKAQWFVIPWQGHPFHQDSLTKEEWILEVSPGNAGPSSQASHCKYYTLVSFHQYEYVTVCGWIAGFKKLGPPKSHRLPADRV